MDSAGAGLLAALEAAPLAVAMRQDLWLYPIVEILHICGFVVLVGSIVVLDLRLLGLTRALPARVLARHVLPWALGALLVIVPTGFLMFMTHASEFVDNRAFQVKLGLILLAGLNAALFHTGAAGRFERWEGGARAPAAVRLHAGASIAIWVGVISCGRLLAYV